MALSVFIMHLSLLPTINMLIIIIIIVYQSSLSFCVLYLCAALLMFFWNAVGDECACASLPLTANHVVVYMPGPYPWRHTIRWTYQSCLLSSLLKEALTYKIEGYTKPWLAVPPSIVTTKQHRVYNLDRRAWQREKLAYWA